jgi:flagellar motility protein MotE (MotC chaperone)
MAKKLLSLVIIFNLVFPSYAFGEGEEAPTEEQATYDVISLKKGEPAPFDGVFFSTAAAAKIAVDKKFEDAECDLRIGYELHLQQERLELQLSYKDIEIKSWESRYEQMMILKTAENDRLYDLVTKRKPDAAPWFVALGFAIGTATSLGIFALSTEIVQ